MNELPLLDPSGIRRLHDWGGATLVDKLLQLFLANTPVRMDEARSGLAEGDIGQVEQACHSLKSSAGNLGAARLQALAAEMEEKAAAGESDALDQMMPRLESIHAETCASLERVRGEVTGP